MDSTLIVSVALSCNDLSVSILRKSEQEMLRILEQFPQSIHQTNQWGQTPLHLAVGWPLGMKKLLDYGADVDSRDDLGMKPLEYAIRLGFAEAVHFLMKARCNLEELNNIDALSFANQELNYPYWRRFNKMRKNRRIVLQTVVTSLAERRRGLQSRLATLLPMKIIDACWTQNDRILDEHAPYVEELLRSHSLLLPGESSLVTMPTVYDVVYLTVELAEMLWQAGFRDIDVPDRDGRTPIMRCGLKWSGNLKRITEITTWLIKRGAYIHRWQHSYVSRDPEQATETTDNKKLSTALHYIAAGIGSCVASYDLPKAEHYGGKQKLPLTLGAQWLRDEISRQRKLSREVLVDIFSDTTSDHCICACSTQGCLASTTLQRTAYSQLRIITWREANFFIAEDVEVPYCRELAMLMTENVIALSGSHNECQTWLADALVRFQTFRELELRHTCCCYDKELEALAQLHPDEVNEIRNEDSEKIELLEELMVEFSEKRGNQDVMTFLKGYWSTRMDEVKRFQGEVDKDKLREIGVILEGNGADESSIEEFEENGSDESGIEELEEE